MSKNQTQKTQTPETQTPEMQPPALRHRSIIRRSGRTVGILLAGVVLAASSLVLPVDDAEARGRGRRGFSGRSIGGFYSAYPGYLYGHYGFYGGHYGHANRRDEGGLHPALAGAMGLAGIDLNIKPRSAEIYVDGRFAGKASDFDGDPTYLWLQAGPHEITITKGGYVTSNERVEVEAGVIYETKLKLEKGATTPPPGAAPNAPAATMEAKPTSLSTTESLTKDA